EVAAARLAPLAEADRRLVIGADVVRAARDLHGVGLPQGKGIDRARRPLPARLAMAITHTRGIARDRELDRTAKATALVDLVVTQDGSPSSNESWKSLLPLDHHFEVLAGRHQRAVARAVV